MAARIYIEGAWLPDNRTGIGRYAKDLATALVTHFPERYRIFAFDFMARGPRAEKLGERYAEYRPIPWISKRWYYAAMKRFPVPSMDTLLGERPDLIWFLDYVIPPITSGVKAIATIYDVSFVKCSQFVEPGNRRFLETWVPRSLARADRVVTISESSRRDIAQCFGFAEDRITVIPPSHNPDVFYPRTPEQVEGVRAKYQIGSDYLLFASTLEPRKNVEGLIEAYAKLPDPLRTKYALVLAGGRGWLDEGIRASLARHADLNIRVLGFVPDEELAALYSGATLFVFPSHYEGFGIPVLEAMACGCPVAVSPLPVFKEVISDAAVVFNSTQIFDITNKLEETLASPHVLRSGQEVNLRRAQEFSWKSSASIAWELLRDVAR